MDGKYVRMIDDPAKAGRYRLVTAGLGNPMGARLQKSDEPLPELPGRMTHAQATLAFTVWERYRARQEAR